MTGDDVNTGPREDQRREDGMVATGEGGDEMRFAAVRRGSSEDRRGQASE